MMFDDVFYPGNKDRRKKVADLRADMRSVFTMYKMAWNEFADILNSAFAASTDKKYSKIRVEKLEKDIEKDTVGDCVTEINTVLEDTQTKIANLVKDIGLADLLPEDWETSGVTVQDIDFEAWVARDIFAGLSITLSGFLAFYTIRGVTEAIAVSVTTSTVAASLGSILGGMAAGIAVGAVAFVITDMIASAITGAIVRKELKEAIDVLTKMDTALRQPLLKSTYKINGIVDNLDKQQYQLDETHYLRRGKDGSYYIVELVPVVRATRNGAGTAAANGEKALVEERYTLLIPAPAA